jgi:hypothetical protein
VTALSNHNCTNVALASCNGLQSDVRLLRSDLNFCIQIGCPINVGLQVLSFLVFQFYVKFIVGDAKTDYLFPRSNVFDGSHSNNLSSIVKKPSSRTCRHQPTTLVAVCYLTICEPCLIKVEHGRRNNITSC